MEINEGRIYNFQSIVNGQQFGFTIAAKDRVEAIKDLIAKLDIIVTELKTSLEQASHPSVH